MAKQTPAPCGTYGGYQRHHRCGETACAPCREANRVYSVQYRKKTRLVDSAGYRNQQARDRALRTLARIYPAEFRRLYEMEKTGEVS